MKLRCNLPTCAAELHFDRDPKPIERKGKRYCGAICADTHDRQNELIAFAAAGGPIYGRRPTRPRRWHERDG